MIRIGNLCRLFGIVISGTLIITQASIGNDNLPGEKNRFVAKAIRSLAKMEQPDFSGENPSDVAGAFNPFMQGFGLNKEKWRTIQDGVTSNSNGDVTIRECTVKEIVSGICKAISLIKGPAAYLVLESKKTGKQIPFTFGPYGSPFEFTKSEDQTSSIFKSSCSWYKIKDGKIAIAKNQADGPMYFKTNDGAGCERVNGAAVPKSFCMGLIKCTNEKMPDPILRVCPTSGEAASTAPCPPADQCVADKTFPTSNAAKETKDARLRKFNGPIRIGSNSKSGGSIIVAIAARETAPMLDGPTEYSYGAMVQPGFQEVLHGQAKPKEITFENIADDQCVAPPTNREGNATPVSIQSYFRIKNSVNIIEEDGAAGNADR